MKAVEVKDGIYSLSMNLEDALFEEMWEIPHGVSVNSYIVKGEKTALIDGACGWEGVPEQFYEMLDELDIKIGDIDYLVINHMEPDHSGWIEDFEKLKPNFQIFCTGMAKKLLKGFFGESDQVTVVKPGMKIDLGAGKELEFIPQPLIHWPDTMMTRETSTNTLFTCDMFGTYGICDEINKFDDQWKDGDLEYFEEEEIRYYSNVMCTFNDASAKAVAKVREIAPSIIAPGHGPIYRKNPNRIIDRYDELTGFLNGKTYDEITIVYGSMYGMTEKAINKMVEILERENVKYNLLKVPHTTTGLVMSKAIRSYGLILGMPTYEDHLFPPMAYAVDELGRKKIMGKKVLSFGSYGWAGGAKKEFAEIIEKRKLDWDIISEVYFGGSPLEKHLVELEEALMQMINDMRNR